MLARSGHRNQLQEHHDYDNPTLEVSTMSLDRHSPTGPRMSSSHESLDAGAIRPAMINIIPGEGVIAAAQTTEVSDETAMTLAPGDDIEQSRLKGLFKKKDKKDKEKKNKAKKEKKEKKEKKDKKNDKKKDEDIEAGETDMSEVEIATTATVAAATVGDEIEVLDDVPLPMPAAPKPSLGSKLKGLFKGRGKGEKEPVVTAPSSDNAGLEAANPAYESSIHSPVDPHSPVAVGEKYPAPETYQSSRPLSSLLRKPVLPPPDEDVENEVAETRPVPKSHPVRCSNVLNAILILGMVLGLLFVILHAVNGNMTLGVIGPVFLGLSAFAMVGKIFITLFWQEDPLPRLTPYVQKLDKKLEIQRFQRIKEEKHVIARSSHYGMTYENYDSPGFPGQPAYPPQPSYLAEPQRYGRPTGGSMYESPIYAQDKPDPRETTKAPTFI